MTTELKHKTAAAIDFLRWYIPNDSWTLVAIIPDGKTETETFDPKKPGDAERCAAWIESRQGKRNLYYQVNKTRLVRTTHKDGTPYESKPGKEHTLTLRALHVDLDPRAGEEPAEEYQRALKLLKAFNPPPSAIIASGGGVNALWKLAPPAAMMTSGWRSTATWRRPKSWKRTTSSWRRCFRRTTATTWTGFSGCPEP